MSEITKIIDERESEKKTTKHKKQKKTKTERRKGVAQVIVKVWELNDFVARLS